MRFLILFMAVFALECFLPTFAHASEGKLVGAAHYMDDSKADMKVSPFVGIQVSENCPWMQGMSGKLLAGGGYVDQVDGSDVKKTYGRLAADIMYAVNDGLKFGVGGGLESSKDTYRSFDDYVHVSAEYKLW